MCYLFLSLFLTPFRYSIAKRNPLFCCSYLAPEYFMHGKVSDKIDVYAFGVVLLELLSGRKPINSECPKGQESLVMWVSPCHCMYLIGLILHLLVD